MSLKAKILSASGGIDKLYAEDVFSAYTYTGNGSTQTITNGIDLAGKGGLVWFKNRTATTKYLQSPNHHLYDTARGANARIQTNETTAQTTEISGGIDTFNSNGFTLENSEYYDNEVGINYISWTFRKALKFFDVVTYTGNGDASRVLSHAIGGSVGTIIIKKTSTTSGWMTWHRSLTANHILYMNTTAASVADGFNPSPTDTTFTVQASVGDGCNASGVTYVAYLFAHDTGTDGLIQCGSFTVSSGTGTTEVNLGWEPQFLLTKYNWAGYNWNTYDSSRGWVDTTNAGNVNARLSANLSNAEATDKSFQPSATGFRMANSAVYPGAPVTILYLAIRRPNKPPTTGTQVYNAIARTGTGTAATVTGVGFAPDLDITQARTGTLSGNGFIDRLRGNTQMLSSSNTGSEADFGSPNALSVTAFNMDGVSLGTDAQFARFNQSGSTYINHFFRRAPGVFDVVCYTGTGVAKTEAHGLGVVPELIIAKSRSVVGNWPVYATGCANGYGYFLNGNYEKSALPDLWDPALFSNTGFNVGISSNSNGISRTYVAYLFATKAGISKVGSYTGNGSSQTIDCGFTTGARFILIKRTDSTGDWYVWNTVRGIIAGNDPHLSLNTTTAEVTSDDSIDPASSGFIVNQLAATNINVNAASYIFLAFA